MGHVRCDPLRMLAPQRDARLRDIHPNDGVPIRATADEFTGVVVEAAAPRTLVKELMVNDEVHVDSSRPVVVLDFVPEPFVQFGKLTVVEVSPRDANAIDVAASLVEGLIGQRAPKIDTNEIAT